MLGALLPPAAYSIAPHAAAHRRGLRAASWRPLCGGRVQLPGLPAGQPRQGRAVLFLVAAKCLSSVCIQASVSSASNAAGRVRPGRERADVAALCRVASTTSNKHILLLPLNGGVTEPASAPLYIGAQYTVPILLRMATAGGVCTALEAGAYRRAVKTWYKHGHHHDQVLVHRLPAGRCLPVAACAGLFLD